MRTLRKFTILFLSGLAILNYNYAQTPVPKKCYLHLLGNINTSIGIEMNLVKINDTLYGNYYFIKGTNPYTTGMDDQNGKPIPLCGKVNANGSFTLKENPWEKGASFKGQFVNAQTLRGSWESEKGDKKLPFNVTENYPEGSIPMILYFQKGFTQLVKKPKSPRAIIELALLVPGESTNTIIADTVKEIILEKFVNKPVRITNPDMILNSMRQIYFENYISSNEAIYDATMGASFEWESLKYMGILFNSNYLLTFVIDHYAFTGGAHGISTRDYILLNTRSGKIIGLPDIFKENIEPDLTILLTDKIRQIKGLDRSARLSENGYFVDEIKPSSNFYCTRNGIGFYYNQYEIAPFSSGPTEIFMTFEEVHSLLRPDSIIKDLFK